ncbi:cupin domain-containing protein [Chloroflexota bacterium]
METKVQRKAGTQFYEEWMQKEGIPIYVGSVGVEDLTELPRQPWARHGGLGTFIEIAGTKEEGALLYVVEIPAGGSLEPEKHLYNELIYILRGRGLTEVWHEGQSKHSFEWGEGSLFAIPTNAWHRLVNGGQQPVFYLAKTTAPVVIDAFQNTDFIFNCDYKFTDRYTGRADYFQATEDRHKEGARTFWETNFVPDVRAATLDPLPQKVQGGNITHIRLATWGECHIAEWPAGVHHKAHYGGAGGAVLLGLQSKGYVLVWPKWCGIHPYQDGHEDKVIRMDWKPGSIYCSGAGPGEGGQWFHCHYNTGPEPARQAALKGGTRRQVSQEGRGQFESLREGDLLGRVIEYDDEDPEIRRIFKEELRKNGVEFAMEPVVYRTDPFPYKF